MRDFISIVRAQRYRFLYGVF
jgi:Tat protein secretion system quality control protein TatD with DNase activity